MRDNQEDVKKVQDYYDAFLASELEVYSLLEELIYLTKKIKAVKDEDVIN